ncbi:HPP family protein [Mesotoga sp. TolDC]|uniref:HPP family protein n=1 Tax=Mesotoga sp. TolDC TaxID=1389250 RepID=UPI0011B7E38D
MTVLSVFSILLFFDLISEEVFVASFGASIFILFTTQNQRFSSARSVLGGSVLGLFVALLIRTVDLSISRVDIEWS